MIIKVDAEGPDQKDCDTNAKGDPGSTHGELTRPIRYQLRPAQFSRAREHLSVCNPQVLF
jgi:hypothetical protein